MNLTHTRAREWIHRSLVEPLAPEEQAILDGHLAACLECSAYQASLIPLSHRLQAGLSQRWPAPDWIPAELHRRMSRINEKLRGNRMTQRITNLTRQIAFTAGLVILLAGLAFAITRLRPQPAGGPLPAPISIDSPVPVAHSPEPSDLTPTSLPWPTATPWLEIPYTVAAGDTCSSIASFFNVSVESIVEINGLTQACDNLHIGQVIKIPQLAATPTPEGASTYKVIPGDTCRSLAQFFDISVESLIAVNGLAPDCSNLFVGQDLLILAPTPTPLPVPVNSDTAAGPVQITSLRMFDTLNGWAVGHIQGEEPTFDRVLRTRDGGLTWANLSPSRQLSSNITPLGDSIAASFLDDTHGWAVYYFNRQNREPSAEIPAAPFVWYTSDGEWWNASQPLDLEGVSPEYFIPDPPVFSDPQNGWLLVHVGVGMSHDYVLFFNTTDGGQTWSRIADPLQAGSFPQGCHKSGMAFPNSSVGWLTGDCGGVIAGVFLYQTTDAGQNWAAVSLPEPPGVEGIYSQPTQICASSAPQFFNPQEGSLMVVCRNFEDNTSQGWLYSTPDSGSTWQITPLPAPEGSLSRLDPQTAWYLTQPGDISIPAELFHTQDAGQTWTSLGQPGENGSTPTFIDPSTGWMFSTLQEPSLLLTTQDGGQTWQVINPSIREP